MKKLLFFVFTVLIGISAIAQTGSEFITYKGKILNKQTEGPVYAEVVVRDNETGAVLKTVKVDPETGEFELKLKKGKRYDLCISAKDYKPTGDQLFLFEDESAIIYMEEEKDLDLIKGVVLDAETFKPVRSVVAIKDPNIGTELYSTNTASTGEYYIPFPKGKKYFLSVKADGYIPYSEHLDQEDNVNRKVYVWKDIPHSVKKGHVFDAISRKPLKAKVDVTLISSGKILASTLSDIQTGVYSVNIKKGRKYNLKVSAAGYIPYSITIPDTTSVHRDVYLLPAPSAGTGYILDAWTKMPVAGANVQLTDAREKVMISSISNSMSGLYAIKSPNPEKNHALIIQAPNYNIYKMELMKGQDPNQIIYLQPSGTPQGFEVGKSYVLPEILYDYDKYDIKPQYADSLNDLIYTLQQYPGLVIELGSHTDFRGSDSYNEKLSLNRAKSVVDFLKRRGIDPDRLVAKGYGEVQPRIMVKDVIRDGYLFRRGTVLSKDYIESLKNNAMKEAAHQLNRRTTFKVLRTDFNAVKAGKGKGTESSSTQ